MDHREVIVNRKLFSKASSYTNISSMFRCLGLEEIQDADANNIVMLFDQDCDYSFFTLLRANKIYPASVVVNDFDVNKVLEQIIGKKDHTTMLGRLTKENYNNSMIIPSNAVNAPLDGDIMCYEYVTELYPDHYDVSLKTDRYRDFFVTELDSAKMDIVKEKVSFWMMQDNVQENLEYHIINKIPLEKE